MPIGPRKVAKAKCYCNGDKLTKVPTFPCLGVLFDDQGTWCAQWTIKKNVLARATGATLDFAKRLWSKPLPALLKVYNAKCIPMATYGCDIWGYKDVKGIQVVENDFLRKLLGVPVATPVYCLHEELGMGYISDQITVAPLLRWLRIWAHPSPNLNQLIILDCTALERALHIPWLKYIKEETKCLSCAELFLPRGPWARLRS